MITNTNKVIKSSRATSHINMEHKSNVSETFCASSSSLMVEAEKAYETDLCSKLTRLVTREDLTAINRHESFKSDNKAA
jgi:hypothetical protein